MSEPSVEEILKAKRIVRNNGYTVELPKDELEQAMNIAKGAGYKIKEAPVKKPAPAKPAEPAAPQHPRSWEIASKYL